MNSLLPPNATSAERAYEAATTRIDAIPAPARDLWNADTCPMNLLPWLAWALGIRAWNADWSDAIKRRLVRDALAIARRKGTVESVHAVVQAFGGDMVVREWFELTPKGQPHTFSILLNLNDAQGEPATGRFVEDVIGEIERTKPVRSHFTFTQGLSAVAGIGLFGGAMAATYRRLEFEQAA